MTEPVRSGLAFVVSVVLIAGVLSGREVAARPPRAEVAAADALAKAEADFLAMNYASGAARLDRALHACAPNKCAPATRAALLRDIGTMEFRSGDRGFAMKAFGDALRLRPTIDLNPSYDSPDVRVAWAEVKTRVAPTAPTVPSAPAPAPVSAVPPSPPPPAVPPPPTFPQPRGDFTHAPAAEQTVDTPLPVYIEGGPAGVYHVLVRFKSAQDGAGVAWQHMDLEPVGHGWGAYIPCSAVLAGATRYYIQAYNPDMDPIGSNGDAKNPYQVPVREALYGPPPHLPNHAPPRTCHEKSKPAPIVATTPSAPPAASAPPAPRIPAPAGAATPAASGVEGKTGEGESEEAPAPIAPVARLRRFWVGINAHLDFVQLPSGNGLCKLAANTAFPLNDKHIFCTDSSGTDFPVETTPAGVVVNRELGTPASAGVSNGGISAGNLRIFASLDYALNSNVLVGVRGGYVADRYPGAAAIVHGYAYGTGLYVEVRATAVIGKDALTRGGFAPVAFVGGGASAFDEHTSGTATLCATSTPASNTTCFPPGGPAIRPTPVHVDMWWTNGPIFLDGGVGLRYAPIAQLGFMVAVRANVSFGKNGVIPTLGPEVGAQLGF
jgi:hypothetical protein